MKTILKREQAEIVVEGPTENHKNRVQVHPVSNDLFIPIKSCETSYPLELIEEILNVQGPAYLCSEIVREESPDYVQRHLQFDLLSYLDRKEFSGKRILDFGCGGGSSTMILGRMFPEAEIVGVELEVELLAVARSRAKYYGVENKIKLLASPNEDSLPPDIGEFDYIILSAVYEHLLPPERKKLLPLLWNHLKPGGILFLNQTPYRWFPVELHTTSGLPLINYLPDSVANLYARKFSKRNLQDEDWNSLLRKGIRGGSVREILQILKRCNAQPDLLVPDKGGINDRVDLWHARFVESQSPAMLKILYYIFKAIKMITGMTMVHNLSLAIKKDRLNPVIKAGMPV